jgi:LysM repeat protein
MIKLIFLTASLYFHSPGSDSLRTETINGQMFVIHQVGEKETLYALSRRYSVTVTRILEFNPTADGGLEVGQLIKVPYVPRTRTQTAEGTKHKVQPKETLFSISRMYTVSVDDIKLWNNLKDNSISVGQELLVSKAAGASTASGDVRPPVSTTAVTTSPSSLKATHTVAAGETMYGISRAYNVSIDQLKAWNGLTANELKVGQLLLITQPANQPGGMITNAGMTTVAIATPAANNVPAKTEPVTTVQVVKKDEQPTIQPVAGSPVKISENVLGTDEVRENGLAELIEGAEGGRKYLALHRTAKAGSIIKVRNELNNREVFVRVAGTLPNTGVNDNLVVKISKSAYDRLGAMDPRFRVEVTYYK